MALSTTPAADAAVRRNTTGWQRHLPAAGRILMGLLFFVFGLFGLLISFGAVTAPSPPMPEGAKAFSDALTRTGYMVPLSSGTELLVGALLLSNRFVPLALTLIAPVLVHIFLFHAVLEPSGIGMAVFLGLLEIALAWAYRDSFRPLLTARTTPAAQGGR